MKKYLKKAVSLLLAMALSMGLSANVFAAETVSPYEAILNEVNAEYGLDLGYVPVDESKVTLEQYEEKTREFAAEQRELLDYIASRETCAEPGGISRASGIKTRTKATWNLGQYFTITATYTVYDGSRISSCRNAKLNMTNTAIFTNTYLTNISGPTYSVIDGGRTSTVKYTATVHFDSIIGYSNTSLYTEFYYSES